MTPLPDDAHVERLIAEAIERGELEPGAGAGRPFGPMSMDPDWWVRAFLEREGLPDRRTEIMRFRTSCVEAAIAAATLDDARAALARANREVRRWNEGVPEVHRIAELSEIWLLDARAGRPGTGIDPVRDADGDAP